jgi:membrane-associated phospholipid phosphatase
VRIVKLGREERPLLGSARMFRAVVSGALAISLGLSCVGEARAETRPLAEPRTDRYYYLHGGLTLGAFVLSGVEEFAATYRGPGYDLVSFAPDDVVRENLSDSSAHFSDKLLLVTMTAPLFMQMSGGFDRSMGNASLIYAESQAFNLLAASTAKLIVRRPRPYTHSHDPQVLAFIDRQGSDAYASFYSGHASAAFTSAMAGSLLYAARTDNLAARHAVWGFEFLLAGMTAQLRVRAGRHYRTDIWTGTLMGLGMGVVVPALHGVQLGRVRGSELLTAGGAFGVTMLLSEVVNFCGAVDVLHLCGGRDVLVPLTAPLATPASWVVLPTPLPGGAGLSLAGEL